MARRALRSRVTPRALSRPDRAGDPLDGLVNLFDLGIVLAVAFLLAALSSLKLSDLLTDKDVTVLRSTPNGGAVIVKRDAKVQELQLSGQRVVGKGEKVGSVYRLSDGREVYVKDADAAGGGALGGATGPSGPSGPGGVTPPASGSLAPGSTTGPGGPTGTTGPTTATPGTTTAPQTGTTPGTSTTTSPGGTSTATAAAAGGAAPPGR